jgi:hypothetical protein
MVSLVSGLTPYPAFGAGLPHVQEVTASHTSESLGRADTSDTFDLLLRFLLEALREVIVRHPSRSERVRGQWIESETTASRQTTCKTDKSGPVAQWIERRFPKPGAQVRLLAGP